MMAGEKHTGWVNILKNEDSPMGVSIYGPFNSEEEALKEKEYFGVCIATIKIEWED